MSYGLFSCSSLESGCRSLITVLGVIGVPAAVLVGINKACPSSRSSRSFSFSFVVFPDIEPDEGRSVSRRRHEGEDSLVITRVE